MKILFTPFLAAALSFGALSMASAQTIVFSDDFNSPNYSTGALGGQKSWVIPSGRDSPDVTTGTGVNTTQVLGKATTSVGTVTSAKKSVTLGLGSYTGGTMSMDLYHDANANNFTGFGIGSTANSGEGVAFVQVGNDVRFRPAVDSGSPTVVMQTSGGTAYSFASSKWLRLTINLDFTNTLTAEGTITSVFAENLTDGGTIQLYFDTMGTATQTYAVGEENWNSVYVRAGTMSQGAAFVDNVSLSVVPEPGSIALMLLGSTVLLARRRRRTGK